LIQFRIALKYESEESSGYQLVSVMLKTPSSLKKKERKMRKNLFLNVQGNVPVRNILGSL